MRPSNRPGGEFRSAQHEGSLVSPPPGRPKAGSLPLGGMARSAQGVDMSPPPGRSKAGSLSLGGVA